jgi:hypothetical protein
MGWKMSLGLTTADLPEGIMVSTTAASELTKVSASLSSEDPDVRLGVSSGRS